MDLSFLMVFSTTKNIDPTDRQNLGDAPGQIPKLILTLCLKVCNDSHGGGVADEAEVGVKTDNLGATMCRWVKIQHLNEKEEGQ